MNGVCPWHEKYEARRMPRSRCEVCWALWDLVTLVNARRKWKQAGHTYPRLEDREEN